MAKGMPTSVEMQRAFNGRGVSTETRAVAAQLQSQERAGRMMRDAAVQDNCTVQLLVTASFVDAEDGIVVSDWMDFGNMKFTKEPVFTTGSRFIPSKDAPRLNDEATNFDPSEHDAVPCVAMVLAYKTDQRGLYSAAKLLFFALDYVSSDYTAKISAVFTGPAVRKA